MYTVAITLFEQINRAKSQLIMITGSNYCHGTGNHSTRHFWLLYVRLTLKRANKAKRNRLSIYVRPIFVTRHVSNEYNVEDSSHTNFRSMCQRKCCTLNISARDKMNTWVKREAVATRRSYYMYIHKAAFIILNVNSLIIL